MNLPKQPQPLESLIPAGYWKDAKGALIPETKVKEIDKARDQLVKELIDKSIQLSAQMAEFKRQSFADIAAFVELSAEQYGANLGGKKGNLSLYSFDGRFKIVRAISDSIVFDERIQAAKALIDACVKDWIKNASDEIKAIVDNAFATDKQGNINTGRVLQLRRLEIKDERWLKAMDAISDSLQVVGSKSYIRVYERIGDSDQYKPIPLDLAAVHL